MKKRSLVRHKTTPLTKEQAFVYVPANGKQPRLNPVYEAAIAERLQFDGDIPELRTGPLPEGAKPAVPVKTSSRSMVAIGMMLETASEQVLAVIGAHHQRYLAQDKESGKYLPVAVGGRFLSPLHSPDSDPPEYRRGERPSPVVVETPTVIEIMSLSDEQRSQYYWKAISSTQGRRTITPILKSEIQKQWAHCYSLDVVLLEDSEGEVLAEAEWTTSLIGGHKTAQHSLPLVPIVSGALSILLYRDLEKKNPMGLVVTTIDEIADRVVGWRAQIVGM